MVHSWSEESLDQGFLFLQRRLLLVSVVQWSEPPLRAH